MRLNAHTTIVSRQVQLVPYGPEHVPRYHQWMQDPFLLETTASEPLTLEEEYENQRSWREDAMKLTFIVCERHDQEASEAPDAKVSTSGNKNPDMMVGDVNAFLSEHEDYPGEWVAELEVMIAEPTARGKSLATQALHFLMRYIHLELKQVTLFMVKIGDANAASLQLFQKRLGFAVVKHSAVFRETELHLPVDAGLVARLNTYWEESGAEMRTLPSADSAPAET